jgi:chromosome segregation ATPase
MRIALTEMRNNMVQSCSSISSSKSSRATELLLTTAQVHSLTPPLLVEVLSAILKVHRDRAELVVRDILHALAPEVSVARRLMQSLHDAYDDLKRSNADIDHEMRDALEVYRMLVRLRKMNRAQDREMHARLYNMDSIHIELALDEPALEQMSRAAAQCRVNIANTKQFLVDARPRHKAEQQRAREADVAASKEQERAARAAEGLSQAGLERAAVEARITQATLENRALEARLQELLCQRSQLGARVESVGRQVEDARGQLSDACHRLQAATLGASFLTRVAGV